MNHKLTSEEIINQMPIGLLAWYSFDKGGDILFLQTKGDDRYDSLVLYLRDAGKIVDVVEIEQEEDDTFIGEPKRENDNIEDNHYTYVVAIETLEKVKNPKAFLIFCKNHLKENGTLLLGLNNALGLKYFCGERDPYTGRNFDGIENYKYVQQLDRERMKGQLYTRAQIDKLLCEAEFRVIGSPQTTNKSGSMSDAGFGTDFDHKVRQEDVSLLQKCDEHDERDINSQPDCNEKMPQATCRQFSVFPSLSWPQLLIREDTFVNESLTNRFFPMYDSPATCFLDEDAICDVIKDSALFHQMADAFLLECSLDGKGDVSCNVTVSPDRGEEFSTATVIREDNSVKKVPLFPEGKKSMETLYDNMQKLKSRGLYVVDMTIEDGVVTMPFLQGENGVEHFATLYEKAGRDEFIKKIDEFVTCILQSSEQYTDEKPGEVILKEGYIDLCPINCIVENDRFVFIDQEFVKGDLPAKVLINRLIDIVYGSNAKLQQMLPRSYFDEKYDLGDNHTKWIRPVSDYISNMRNQHILADYLACHKKDMAQVNANRQRMNFSVTEYERLFTNALRGLKNKKLYLFGSGKYAENFLMLYGKKCPVAGILDNQESKWGTTLLGVPVFSPDKIKELEPRTYKVLVCIKNYSFVLRQLREMGVSDIGIYDSTREYELDVINQIDQEINDTAHESEQADVSDTAETDNEKQPTPAPKKYDVGYIAGVFDLFHIGHLNLLKRAKEQCNYLIVGVVSDEGVRKNKNVEPYVPFEERLAIVKSCRYVDEAVEIPYAFAGTREAHKLYHFDVQFSGSDYADNPNWLAEKKYLEDHGAEMVFFPYTKSTSSTKLKAAIDKK